MTTPTKPLKFSGMIAPHDVLHQPTTPSTPSGPPDEHYIAPTTITVNMIQPADPPTLGVPQFGTPANGGAASAYDPAGDCGGNFMSYKYQANNNCYAYGCNISTNTFPQPGRQSGYQLPSPFDMAFNDLGQLVSSYAQMDGLKFVGTTMEDLQTYQSNEQTGIPPTLDGHFVALMVSPAGDANWPGDYHWARCDNSNGPCDSWSQKDGGDQVTNFDFAGNLITDPSKANWTVNQGPITASQQTPNPPDLGQDQVVEYAFYCYMFVPETGVNII